MENPGVRVRERWPSGERPGLSTVTSERHHAGTRLGEDGESVPPPATECEASGHPRAVGDPGWILSVAVPHPVS
jgi:hypothetical protein